ncbi:MAG: tetratricopeptide repeat protein [Deltaproteobacteria bacterium]|nr:tetratricopeptide repeat protein [Deltaproteobacteria bacterium]
MKKKVFLVLLLIFFCNPVFAQSKAVLFEKGVEALVNEEFQKSIDRFTLFIEIDPGNAYVYKNRGVAFMKLKQYDSAIQDFEKAKAISPSLKGIHSNLGVAWFCKKEYEKAIENYTQELIQTPEESFLFFNRALCYSELQQNENALQDVSRALELKPDFHLALCFKGDILMKMKRSGEAKTAFEKAILSNHAQENAKQLEDIKQTRIKIDKNENKKIAPESRMKTLPTPETAIPATPETQLKGKFEVQVGAYQNQAYADEADKELTINGYDSKIITLKGAGDKTWYLVRVGLFQNREESKPLILSLKEKMNLNAITRPAGEF